MAEARQLANDPVDQTLSDAERRADASGSALPGQGFDGDFWTGHCFAVETRLTVTRIGSVGPERLLRFSRAQVGESTHARQRCGRQ